MSSTDSPVPIGQFPKYDNLPLLYVNGREKRCAWRAFDKTSKKDVFGCLNKVTPEVVAKAALEVRDGISISLK